MVLELVDKIVLGIVGLILVTALLPTFISSANGFDWENVTIGSTTYDFGYVPLMLIFGIMFGLVFVGVRQIRGASRGK